MRNFNLLSIVVFILFFIAPSLGLASPDSKDPKDWYGRAQQDYLAAAKLIKEKELTEVVCFHSHQAIEKILKGKHYELGKIPERTHKTLVLAKGLQKNEPKVRHFFNALAKMDQQYIPSRYPKKGAKPITEKTKDWCFYLAEKVIWNFGDGFSDDSVVLRAASKSPNKAKSR